MKVRNISIKKAGEFCIEVTNTETKKHALLSRTLIESYIELTDAQQGIIDKRIIDSSVN